MEGEEEGISFAFGMVPDGVGLALRNHGGTADGGDFTPERIGLDHASFAVASREVLEAFVFAGG